MKLFVDDLRKCPDGWELTRTVTQAIRILATQQVTHVSLDHDISHRVEMDEMARPFPCGETFEPVARYIAMMAYVAELLGNYTGHPRSQLPRVTLHTANAVGAEAMRAILADVGVPCEIRLGRPCNGLEDGGRHDEGG